ncbi:heterokaryon incompatibility protein [Colletotrichum plurivorum]|uniref:Heterokaryon incompatibility protein n=1 Tax=Colletotrichum plurivorum TaxID=2175906 RepID=A0A8H6JH37_9PEZI|nr:heterokaryon incompatibility protein [Colletotrichum plurivorum]
MASIYTRRLPARWIRLIVLHPGSGPDPIEFHFQETSIDDPPPFQALSYVWGDPTFCCEVHCSGNSVSITQSLFDALRHFRLPDAELTIWADAICINQADMEERGEQVQLMREIYSRAEGVVVWLGPDAEGRAARAVPLMGAIYDACQGHALSKGVELLSMAHFTPATESQDGLAGVSISDIAAAGLIPDEASWDALRWLLSRPWFTRVWCVQEIVLARSSRVHVGSRFFDWEKLGVTVAWFSEQNLASDYDVPRELQGVSWENAYGMFDTSEISELSFLEILTTFRDFDATNPRDKVYGLLGLAIEEALEGFPGVDYRKSVAEVYADVIKTSVASTGTLISMGHVKHKREYSRTEFPSWVPRWDVNEDVSNFLHSLSVDAWEEGDKHGLPILSEFNPSQDGEVSLSGVRFDSIAWTTDVLDIGHFKEDLTSTEASVHPFLEIWHRASSNKCYALFPNTTNSFSAVLEMASTLTAGFNDGYERVVELQQDERQQFYADFLTYVRQLFDTATNQPKTFDPLEVALCVGDASRFRVAASRSCDQRRVFETAKGFYGLAPACAIEGDWVVLLHGGPIPFVLRQTDEGWVLLGDCFVGPLMPESADDDIRGTFGEEETFSLT